MLAAEATLSTRHAAVLDNVEALSTYDPPIAYSRPCDSISPSSSLAPLAKFSPKTRPQDKARYSKIPHSVPYIEVSPSPLNPAILSGPHMFSPFHHPDPVLLSPDSKYPARTMTPHGLVAYAWDPLVDDLDDEDTLDEKPIVHTNICSHLGLENQQRSQKVTQTAYYAYRLQQRTLEFNAALFWSERLFQQCVVDAWASTEQNKLN
ncbi:hypothetical protein J132_10778 [Termitomyces sp. J132]|nr:hypothetical protein J132_10778 [Termitomyces sp. J132]